MERTKAIMRKEMTLKIPSSLILSILRLLILVNIILLLLLLQLSCSSIIKYKFSIKIPSLSALMQYGDIEEQKKMFFFSFLYCHSVIADAVVKDDNVHESTTSCKIYSHTYSVHKQIDIN